MFAALASAPFALPAKGPIRAAVIGTGHGHALSKIRALRSMPEYELTGVCRPLRQEPVLPEPLSQTRSLALEDIDADSSI